MRWSSSFACSLFGALPVVEAQHDALVLDHRPFEIRGVDASGRLRRDVRHQLLVGGSLLGQHDLTPLRALDPVRAPDLDVGPEPLQQL